MDSKASHSIATPFQGLIGERILVAEVEVEEEDDDGIFGTNLRSEIFGQKPIVDEMGWSILNLTLANILVANKKWLEKTIVRHIDFYC